MQVYITCTVQLNVWIAKLEEFIPKSTYISMSNAAIEFAQGIDVYIIILGGKVISLPKLIEIPVKKNWRQI